MSARVCLCVFVCVCVSVCVSMLLRLPCSCSLAYHHVLSAESRATPMPRVQEEWLARDTVDRCVCVARVCVAPFFLLFSAS